MARSPSRSNRAIRPAVSPCAVDIDGTWTNTDSNDTQDSTLTDFCPGSGYWIDVNSGVMWGGW